MQPVIAHYHCEIGEAAFNKALYELAKEHAEKAGLADGQCVRASLLHARIDMHTGDYRSALEYLKKIKEQNSDYLSEAIDLMASCYEKLNKEDELVVYLSALLEEYPRIPVVLILVERIRKWKGDKVAARFIGDYVRRYPSLRGLYMFVNIYMSSTEGRAKEDLKILQNLMKKVLAVKPEYQCTSCGFSGKTLHWQCPGCKSWSTVMPISSLEEQHI